MDKRITKTEALAALRLDCLRCGHGWQQTKIEPPRVCPSCHSPYYARPRRVKTGLAVLFVGVALSTSACASPLRMTGYGSGGTPTQSIEMYDASGRHVGYGKVQGGTLELYKPNSSRMGYGKTGR